MQKTVLKPKIVAGIDMMIHTVSSVLAICTNPKTFKAEIFKGTNFRGYYLCDLVSYLVLL